MKTRNVLFFSVFFLMLSSAMAETIRIDAFTSFRAYVYNGEKVHQKLSFLQEGPDGRPATRLTWDSGKKNYAEINLRKAPLFSDFQQLDIDLEYYSDGSGPIKSIGFRMLDAKNECFQWIVPIRDQTNGWKTIRAKLKPENFSDSWGKGKTGKIQFPIRLIGFATGFESDSSGPVFFREMSCRIPEKRPLLSARTHRWSFDDESERWNSWGSGRMRNHRILSEKPGNACLNERLFPLKPIAEPDTIELEYTLERGNADLFLTVLDGNRKAIELPGRPLQKGKNTLSWKIRKLTAPLQLSLLRIQIRSKQTELRLHTLEVWERKVPEACVQVEVETGHPLHLILPEGEQKAVIRLENQTRAPLRLQGEFEICDYFGRVDSFSHFLSFTPRQVQTISLPVGRYPRNGIFFVRSTFRDPESGEVYQDQHCFARMVPAGPTPASDFRKAGGFLFGICTHTERWGRRDRKLEVLAAALSGAKIIRNSVGWGEIQPTEGIWNYSMFDELVDRYRRYGIELQGGFGLCARWGKAADAKLRDGKPDRLNNGRSMPDLNAWTTYVRKTAARYQDRIRYWEVWNEPDLVHFANFGVEDYLRLQAATFQAVREAAPAAKIMNGGFAGLGNNAQIQYQKTFLKEGKGTFDLHAFHQHGDFRYFRKIIDEIFLPLRRETGCDRIAWYANETAMHSLGGQDLAQAETLFKKLIFSWARGAVGYTWYDLRNDGFSTTDAEHNYGMMTNDFYPKAVYPAYAALVRLYREMEFLRELNPGKGEYLYLFRQKNGRALAAATWREPVEAAFSGTLFAGVTDGTSMEISDIMGNRRPLTLHGGKFLHQSSAIPETLLIHGGSNLTFIPVLKAESSGPAAEGHIVRIQVSMRNPFPEKMTMRLKFKAPAEFEPLSALEHQLEAMPGAESSASMDFRIRKMEDSIFQPFRIAIAVRSADGAEAELGLPVYPAKQLSRKGNPHKPDFLLNKRNQVVSLYDKVPGHSIWEGEQDLSAKLFCSLTQEELRLTALVQDDIHRPEGTGAKLWKGDSAQFFLEVANRGIWIAGGAMNHAGVVEKWIWNAPAGFSAQQAKHALKIHIMRKNGITTYLFRIPRKEFGLSEDLMQKGFRFNFLINDSDTERDGREGWIRLAPGAGDEIAPLRYPLLFFPPDTPAIRQRGSPPGEKQILPEKNSGILQKSTTNRRKAG